MSEQEVTNKVLDVKIDSLTKTTEIQLGHVNEALKDLKTLVTGFVTKAELEEVKKDFNESIKRIDGNFAKHSEDDIKSFGGLSKQVTNLRNIILTATGVIATIIFFIQYILPYWVHK